MCHWCSYHISTSSVIYYWRDAQQHGIYLLYIITKQTTTAFFISKSFNITRGPAGHFGEHEKAIWRNLLSIKMKQSRWLLCVCETTVIGPGKSHHCQTWLAWLLLEWKLTAKAELSCEIHRSSRKCWKSQVQSNVLSATADGLAPSCMKKSKSLLLYLYIYCTYKVILKAILKFAWSPSSCFPLAFV